MKRINKILFFLTTLVASSIEQSDIFTGHWLNACRPNVCSETAFSLCWNCFGERVCKSCISFNKWECSTCADGIYNKENLEKISGNHYLICDSMDSIQSRVCHLFCRGQYSQSDNIIKNASLNLVFIAFTSFTSTLSTITKESTTTTSTQAVHFNGTVKLNVSISNSFQRILSLPNGDLIRGSEKNFIEIWDIEKGVIKGNLTSAYSYPYVFSLLSNGDLVAAYFFIWDLKTTSSEPLKRIMQAEEKIFCLTVLKNDDLAVGQFGSKNFDIVIRDSQEGNIRNRLVGHKNTVFQIIEMENGNLVSCSDDRTVKVWNVKTGDILNSITHTTYVRSIAFLNNGFLASGLSDGTINIWNFETNQLIRNLIGHRDAICAFNCLHVLGNGDLLSASWDTSLRVWNSSNGIIKLNSNLHKSTILKESVDFDSFSEELT
ncbi:WD-40 repeat [Brachionus plicatilis]|uniref:WD-40 repeat n=1 Tax=Brachionus plicatilis TaxID=10195 RepID=A0A3M7Q4D5_BRAPC|nr:WD-40 repeat [Brachionus plicatilis]